MSKPMSETHRWRFKACFRREAYGWAGTSLASKRLREAVSEIKKVGKSDPALAGEGAVSLMERLWPSLQHIDGSSGALGNAVYRTLEALIPILIEAPANIVTRRKWLDRLFLAIEEDGVDYLGPVEERWGEISGFSDLANEWADILLPGVEEVWRAAEPGSHFIGTTACLSCLLETGRYDELRHVLSLRTFTFWCYDKFWAEALARQGQIDDAIAFAESRLDDDYGYGSIMEFCERVLLQAGRRDEAYRKYALCQRRERTYLAQYKSIVKKYPERDPRQILLDLIEWSGDKSAWFASARQAGFLDIARDCAYSGFPEPKTLIRAARDTVRTAPQFAADIALRAIDLLLQGYGYEMTTADIAEAYEHLTAACDSLDARTWGLDQVRRLLRPETKDRNDPMTQRLLDLIQKTIIAGD